jgi:hypothetical protein
VTIGLAARCFPLFFSFWNVLFIISKPQGNEVEQSRSKGCVGSVPRDLDHFLDSSEAEELRCRKRTGALRVGRSEIQNGLELTLIIPNPSRWPYKLGPRDRNPKALPPQPASGENLRRRTVPP